MISRRTLFLSLLFLALTAPALLAPRTAHAVSYGCSDGTFTAISFGTNVNPTNPASINASGQPGSVFGCHNYYSGSDKLAMTVCINIGNGPNGLDADDRRLIETGIPFQLYTSAARSEIWGGQNSAWPTNWVSFSFILASGASQSFPFTIYATLFRPLGNVQSAYYQTDVPMTLTGAISVGPNPEPPPAASACTQTFPKNWSGRVNPSLQVVWGTYIFAYSMDFGTTIGLFNSPIDQSSQLLISCPQGSENVTLDNGQHYANGSRQMESENGNYVTYSLYQDAAHTKPWGTTVGTDTVPVTCDKTVQTLTIYGLVPPQAPEPVGGYTDTVTVTLTN